MLSLDESTDAILAAMVAAIQAEMGYDGSLSEVKEVIRGDRKRGKVENVQVWVVPYVAEFIQGQYGDEEDWAFGVSISAMVKETGAPADGGRRVQQITARARGIAASCKAAMVTAGVNVTDLRTQSFDPTVRLVRNANLYFCEAILRVTFTSIG